MYNFSLKIRKKLVGIIVPFSRDVFGNTSEQNKNFIKQIVKAIVIIVSAVTLLVLLVKLVSFADIKKPRKPIKAKEEKLTLEFANKAIEGDKMWRNKLEEELLLSNERNKQNEVAIKQLSSFKEEVAKKEQQRELDNALTINQLSEQVKFLTAEVMEKKQEDQLNSLELANAKAGLVNNCEVKSMSFSHGRVKDKRYYIPMSSFVSGKLTTGISVSTSMNSTHDPVDATIQLADIETPSGISLARGNLPKDFAVDLKKCRIEGSAYGDLASERIIIRGEKMICELGDRYIETDIVAVVRGDDGKNGIKGRVVDTSQKQVNNAIIGAVVSGLSTTAKQNDQFTVTGAGLLNTRKMPLQERMGNNVLSGLGSAGEKYADYHLRRAETMSPVLQVDGGVRVDVKFRYGAFLGDEGAEQKVRQLREDTLRNNHVQNHGQGGQASE